MKQLLLICASAMLLMVTSCTKQEESPTHYPLRFYIESTRVAVDYPASDYFGLTELSCATVSVKTSTVKYAYSNGVLEGATDEDCLYFPVDGSSLASVKVRWPEDAVRATQSASVVKDQSTKMAFLSTDWLSAELKNVASTQPIVLTLGHDRPKLTFTLTGSMAGKKITSLSIAGYKAYCDAASAVKDAQLILLPSNTDITADAIGIVGIEGESNLRNFMTKTVPALAAGQNHTIQINF